MFDQMLPFQLNSLYKLTLQEEQQVIKRQLALKLQLKCT